MSGRVTADRFGGSIACLLARDAAGDVEISDDGHGAVGCPL